MQETVKLLITVDGLALEFASLERKQLFLEQMLENGIDIFLESSVSPTCYFKNYQQNNPVGYFISTQLLVSLAFHTEQHKYIFKEAIGLHGQHFMDLGPGYEAQLHFNPEYLASVVGDSLTTQSILSSEDWE